MSVAMLDITNNDTVSWLSQRLDILTSSVSSSGSSRGSQAFDLPEVAFFVDSGSFENLPAYFQVIIVDNCLMLIKNSVDSFLRFIRITY